MKITFNVDIDDLVAFNKYLMETLPTFKKQKRFMLITFPLILLCVFIALTFVERSFHPILSWIFITFIYEISMIFIRKNRIPNLIKKISKDQSSKGIFCEHTIEIVEDGIIEKTNLNERKDFWEGISKVDFVDNRAYILIGQNQAHVINSTKIVEGNLDEFLGELNNKLLSKSSFQDSKQKV